MKNLEVSIKGRIIGPDRPSFVICEAGVTNYGEFDLAKKQIDAAVTAGVDAIKFQLWRTENLISKKISKRLEGELGFNWFDRLKYKELSKEEVKALQDYATEKNILFFATPHDLDSLKYLTEDLKVPLLKVGSGEAHNYDFLRAIGQTGLPVLISFGFQTDSEILKAVKVLKEAGAAWVVPMHCTTAYPTPPAIVNLKRLEWFRDNFGPIFGFSDHSVGWHICLAARTKGALVFEKHLTFDKTDPRSLDNPGALLPDEFKQFVSQTRDIEESMVSPSPKVLNQSRDQAREWAGQSIVVARDVKKGEIIEMTMLAFKRPAKGGLSPEQTNLLIGKRAKNDISEDEQILLIHLY